MQSPSTLNAQRSWSAVIALVLASTCCCWAKLYDKNDMAELRTLPRVILAYVSDQDWALVEFLCMLHASWRYALLLPGSDEYKLDLIVFTGTRYAGQLASVCQPLTLDDYQHGGDPHPAVNTNRSQCFMHYSAPADPSTWYNYPFVNNVMPITQAPMSTFLLQHYGFALKTDCDTFITPTFLHFFPDRFTFGVQEYVLLPETSRRLEEVANKVNLPPPQQHNLGPSWYGDVTEVHNLARISTDIMHHIVSKEFEQKPEGGIKQAWQQGEGWPAWSAGMAALYATEIAAGPVLNAFTTTTKMDAHTDSDGLIAGFYLLHARHGDSNFSKFEFFEHHYDMVDLRRLEVSVVREYCLFVAVSTWRQLAFQGDTPQANRRQPLSQASSEPYRDEL